VNTLYRFDLRLAGLHSDTILFAVGMTVHSSSSHLAGMSCALLEMLVVLPPGRAWLTIRPAPSGSMSPVMTTGVVSFWIHRGDCLAGR